jgi:chromosome segregation ATPase
MSEFINAKPGAVEATAQRQEPFTIDRVYVGAVSKDNRGTDLYYKVLYPNGSTSRHMTSVHAVLRDLLFMEQLNKDLRAALHKAGDELGEARRECSLKDDRIEELERRNANQATMIARQRSHDGKLFAELEETRAALARTAQRAAAAEQREAALSQELAEIEADELEGDEIIAKHGGPEFDGVDTYSELATEAVRLADEVQDLKKALAGRTLTPTGEAIKHAYELALVKGTAFLRFSVIHDETTYEVLGEGEVRGFYALRERNAAQLKNDRLREDRNSAYRLAAERLAVLHKVETERDEARAELNQVRGRLMLSELGREMLKKALANARADAVQRFNRWVA